MNDLRSQLRSIDPNKVRAEDVVAEENETARKLPRGKLVVGGVLLAVLAAGGYGMLAGKRPSSPDPKDLGAASAPVAPTPKPPIAAESQGAAAVPVQPAAVPLAPQPAPRTDERRPGTAKASATELAATPPRVPAGPASETAAGASAPQDRAKAPAAGPRASAEGEDANPKPKPQAKAEASAKPAPARARAKASPMTRKPAARASIDSIGITEE